MHAAVTGIVAGARSFAKAASEGSFAVSERGGQALLQAITEMRDWIDSQDFRLNVLQQEAPLGSSHGAATMKPYLKQVADDQQGFITMLRQFRLSLNDAEKGINDAMANYKGTDTGIATRYGQA
ncbi:hypothetical protein [Actinophytocola sp.]|jgi:hypothetical protein|uniref:hypothetical protein n=1 Tax=Actinophytocola sp. TaxID=1872138 RepID=UPI002EDB9BDA